MSFDQRSIYAIERIHDGGRKSNNSSNITSLVTMYIEVQKRTIRELLWHARLISLDECKLIYWWHFSSVTRRECAFSFVHQLIESTAVKRENERSRALSFLSFSLHIYIYIYLLWDNSNVKREREEERERRRKKNISHIEWSYPIKIWSELLSYSN